MSRSIASRMNVYLGSILTLICVGCGGGGGSSSTSVIDTPKSEYSTFLTPDKKLWLTTLNSENLLTTEPVIEGITSRFDRANARNILTLSLNESEGVIFPGTLDFTLALTSVGAVAIDPVTKLKSSVLESARCRITGFYYDLSDISKSVITFDGTPGDCVSTRAQNVLGVALNSPGPGVPLDDCLQSIVPTYTELGKLQSFICTAYSDNRIRILRIAPNLSSIEQVDGFSSQEISALKRLGAYYAVTPAQRIVAFHDMDRGEDHFVFYDEETKNARDFLQNDGVDRTDRNERTRDIVDGDDNTIYIASGGRFFSFSTTDLSAPLISTSFPVDGTAVRVGNSDTAIFVLLASTNGSSIVRSLKSDPSGTFTIIAENLQGDFISFEDTSSSTFSFELQNEERRTAYLFDFETENLESFTNSTWISVARRPSSEVPNTKLAFGKSPSTGFKFQTSTEQFLLLTGLNAQAQKLVEIERTSGDIVRSVDLPTQATKGNSDSFGSALLLSTQSNAGKNTLYWLRLSSFELFTVELPPQTGVGPVISNTQTQAFAG